MGKFLGILFLVYFAVTAVLVEGLGMDVAGITGSAFVLTVIICLFVVKNKTTSPESTYDHNDGPPHQPTTNELLGEILDELRYR